MVGRVVLDQSSSDSSSFSYSPMARGHRPTLSQESNTLSQISAATEFSTDLSPGSEAESYTDENDATVVAREVSRAPSSFSKSDNNLRRIESKSNYSVDSERYEKGSNADGRSVSEVIIDISTISATVAAPGELVENNRTEAIPDEPWKTLLSLVLLGLGFFSTTLSLSLTHERVPSTEPLPDIFLDNVPTQKWALDFCEYLLIAVLVTGILVVLFHSHRLVVLRRVWLVQSLLYLYRAITMFVTVLPKPDPEYYCIAKEDNLTFSSVMTRVWTILLGGGLSINERHIYCGDYIFSGHTMTLTLACLVILEYSPSKWFLLHYTAMAATSIGVLFLLLARGHYTIDVLLAYYVTTRVWWVYHTLANNQALKETGQHNSLSNLVWWRVFRFFEQNIPGPVPRSFSVPLFEQGREWLRRRKQRDGKTS